MTIPGIEPRPEIRGPLISLLTQLYTGADQTPDMAVGVDVPDATAGIVDMAIMFVLYAKEAEGGAGADFLEFLHRQALKAEGAAGTDDG